MKEETAEVLIHHTFYEKNVSAPPVLHSKAAFSWKNKLVTLTEEMRRRWEEYE